MIAAAGYNSEKFLNRHSLAANSYATINSSRYKQMEDATPASSGAKGAVRAALEDPGSGPWASRLHCGMVVLILASTALALLSTVEELTDMLPRELEFLEMAFTALFSLEILVRFWTRESCGAYFGSTSNWVDIVATMPWYLEQAVERFDSSDSLRGMGRLAGPLQTLRVVRLARLVRMIRLLRVLRLAKAARHSETMTTVFESIVDSGEGIFVLICMVGCGSIIPATIMYAVESEGKSGHFRSIPESMWWAMATITTVGYGDVVPSTPSGKAVACCTMVLGMIIVSISVAVVTTSFIEGYNRRKQLAKMEDCVKRARQWQSEEKGHASDDNSSIEGNAGEGTPGSLASGFSHTIDKEQLDLVTTFGVLADDTRIAMMRMEQAVHGKVVGTEDDAPALAYKSFRSRARSSINLTQNPDPNLIAFQMLQDQSQAFMRAAMLLAETLAKSEGERRPNGTADASSP